LLNVQRQLLSSSVVPLLQSVLEAAVSPNCPSSFGPMAADVAFALFVIFGAPIGIDADRRRAPADSSDDKSQQAASSKADTSASLLTPTFLLSSCRGFFPLLLSLLIRWLIEIAAAATPACAQSVLGGDAGAEVMAVLGAVRAAHARAPKADPHAAPLRDQVDLMSRAVRELTQRRRAGQAAEERAQKQSAAAAGASCSRSQRPDAHSDSGSPLVIASSDAAIDCCFDPAPVASVFVEANSKSNANGRVSARGRRSSVSLSSSVHTRTVSSAPSSPRQMAQLKFGVDGGGLRAAHRLATLAGLRAAHRLATIAERRGFSKQQTSSRFFQC
jgi:hypothetical protein